MVAEQILKWMYKSNNMQAKLAGKI